MVGAAISGSGSEKNTEYTALSACALLKFVLVQSHTCLTCFLKVEIWWWSDLPLAAAPPDFSNIQLQ